MVEPRSVGRITGADRAQALSRLSIGASPREAAAPRQRAETPIAQAVLRTVAYADVFDHPLTADEVHRYLVGLAAQPASVGQELHRLVPERLAYREGLYMLRGRSQLVETRRRRAAVAAELWPEAVRYGRLLARLPSVRMVAVTGSLTRDNVEAGSDIDYFLATAAGRVWAVRALTGLVRRTVRRPGIWLCPNYILSEEALTLDDRNLVTAYELVQMRPLTGGGVYRRMRELNGWTAEFLPNAGGSLPVLGPEALSPRAGARLGEAVLRTPIGGWVERFEWGRFERKLSTRSANPTEVVYAADCFKDHIDGWGERIRAAYVERILAEGVEP